METQQDIQILYNLIVKALKSGIFENPEEVITCYTSLNNLNNHFKTLPELQNYIKELEQIRDSKDIKKASNKK